MGIYEFSFPTPIRFGVGVRHELPAALTTAGVTRPLVVTDRGIAPLPFLQALVAELTGAGLTPAVFSEFGGNPIKSHVTAGVAAYQAHEADGIVALGAVRRWMWPRRSR